MKYNYEEKIKNIYNPANGKYYSHAQLDQWATDITKIKPNKGANKDKRKGRIKGRYIKGKL
jgi:CRISPR/Cas system-associated protein Cas7 (RAMP superfamily)